MNSHNPSILDRIRIHHLAGTDGPVAFDWRDVADILAVELDALAVRMSDLPDATAADDERVARAAGALRQYRLARAESDQP